MAGLDSLFSRSRRSRFELPFIYLLIKFVVLLVINNNSFDRISLYINIREYGGLRIIQKRTICNTTDKSDASD